MTKHASGKQRAPTRAKKHAEVERISIAGMEWRHPPMFFHVIASDYLRVLEADRFPPAYSHARHFLACRATELALKSFLSLKGYVMTVLSAPPLSHSLEQLLGEAQKAGMNQYLKVNPRHVAEIKKGSPYYSEKVFEYPAVVEAARAYSDAPDVEVLADFATLLLNAIYQDCQKH